MKVAFVSNYKSTLLYHELSQKLEGEGIDIFWINVNKGIDKFLVEQYGRNNVLHIHMNMENSSEDSETGTIDLKINELIYCDRALKHSIQEGQYFLSVSTAKIYTFLQSNGIEKVFGELTWAHEVLIYRICKYWLPECTYLNPHTIRMPKNHFAFFTDESQSILFPLSNPQATQMVIECEKPSYVALNAQKAKHAGMYKQRRKIVEENLQIDSNDIGDPTIIHNSYTRKRKRWQLKLNRFCYRYLVNKNDSKVVKEKKFIFYPLHKQPEASIDTLGRYYEDQKQNILNIWRILPQGWKLVVKEHPTGIGDRSFQFYKDILAYKDIILVRENTDSKELILLSEVVVTVSGTAAYEAALLGKKALTFAPTFFSTLKNVKQISLEDLRAHSSLDSLLVDTEKGLDVKSFSENILKYSYQGNIVDPATDPLSIGHENMANLQFAFLNIIKGVKNV